ncbi:MAG: trans-aconitate 2-methyltransferase [Candidatus Dactylopiibacterium carminicum]|uniref:Trans-aconitate 2-methyltransferase n=1 Tax=Candidatus Dactylopiibacterium carminicum TaxID=857335 RepID=A0A272ERP4_9RHOO|nr:trans-aconitate 2-methyltransferase [Candidatus Dactylopiibacterium carminicum]KAF7598846.1 trans-aconitate 2-methyltransferase [Candidatus Dactylopiibacterium carminicum]PAS92762.1 MAG: trans-aconitate 2-methyltransferase [Candidatus Dactylopiibacterium carminicum]PAS96212.1 MAG: trans-aconitate 2-methyltransferase [Candidatus Dactylopiibacterium carminicum]PAS98864.1 MAG: trans-aconitate 2-methyltransferase [Candidatus Dactylopiibacterium carminicum]
MPHWDDRQYLKFADKRTRPARELLARVPLEAPARVVDLGCGPGNSTALLRERWPQARVTGVDSSAAMLARARQDLPEVEWVEADIARWTPASPPDLIFANAVLQWLPDHASLLPRLFGLLAPGGVLAFQVPDNFNEPSHAWMRDLPGPWQVIVAGVRTTPRVARAADYYDLLAPLAAGVDLWQTRYEHVMKDAAAIVEWVKGTGLRPYLEALDSALRTDYEAAYLSAIDRAYPLRVDGRRLFSFPRLFVLARRHTD